MALGLSAGFLHAETTESLRYSVEDLQGHASLTKADGASEDVKEGTQIGPGEQIQLDPDAQAVLMLNEETTVQLGPGTRLKVSQLETKPQNGFVSKLKLLGGRILSQVQKLGESRSTFEVEGGGVVCGVRGTLFEVELQGEDLEARTQEGEVAVSSNGKNESVKAGRALAYRRGLLRMRRRLDRVETDRFTKWKTFKPSLREKRLKRLHGFKNHRKSETRPLRHRPKATSWVPS
jgi:hypothetical protein